MLPSRENHLFNIHLIWCCHYTHAPLISFACSTRIKKNDIEDCFTLKKDIKRLIAKGYLKHLVKGHAHMECDRKDPSQPIQSLSNIQGDTFNGKRKYEKQVLTTAYQHNSRYELITFTLKDGEGATYSHEDILVISIV
jgi:hypothetical protein